MERVKGIEPSYAAWEAAVLPLNYTRLAARGRKLFQGAMITLSFANAPLDLGGHGMILHPFLKPDMPSATFALRLIAWQKDHGRHDLPWQKTRDPYRIWLSEIMLQQTQVSTVIPYYRRFLQRFPDLRSLAAAPQESVLELWAGLGYYARGRNLHRAAQQIERDFGGTFPSDPAILAKLPGIGRSTAAAIAVFAFGQRAAILDGNVKRVLCRHAGVEGLPGSTGTVKQLWALAETLLPIEAVENYTQGLMDLGSSVCLRRQPECPVCPLSGDCIAYREGRQATLPIVKPSVPVPELPTTFCLITDGRAVLLYHRPPKGIWGGLWVPAEGEPAGVLNELGLHPVHTNSLPKLKHRLTHRQLIIQPVLCRVAKRPEKGLGAPWCWHPLENLDALALPAPFRKLLQHCRVAGQSGDPDLTSAILF